MRPFVTSLLLAAVALCAAHSTRLEAQAVAGPRASVLWAPDSRFRLDTPGQSTRFASPSRNERRFLIGAIIGGVVAGLLGDEMCHAFGANSSESCLGTTLWWATGGAMLGGLIGATSAED